MIAVEDLTTRQGAFALRGVSFEVPSGEHAVLMGRTGSGKTTILEVICGLRRPESGRVRVRGRDVTALPPAERGIGYVPQDRALFQSMTVFDNLAFAPRVRHWPEADVRHRVEELAGQLGIAHLLKRRPAGLSGGEAQRVALGRALAFRPEVLLFDEPLVGLDDETREEMIGLLQSLRRQAPLTLLHVTHSRFEARRLADRVLVLREGTVREAGDEERQGDKETRRQGDKETG